MPNAQPSGVSRRHDPTNRRSIEGRDGIYSRSAGVGKSEYPREQCGLGGWPEPHLFLGKLASTLRELPYWHVIEEVPSTTLSAFSSSSIGILGSAGA